jgi:hypothetical protein
MQIHISLPLEQDLDRPPAKAAFGLPQLQLGRLGALEELVWEPLDAGGSSSIRRMNSKHLASCEDDEGTGNSERRGDASPAWRPRPRRPRPRSRPPRPAMDSLAGVVRERERERR